MKTKIAILAAAVLLAIAYISGRSHPCPDCPIKTVIINGHPQKAVMKDGKPHGYHIVIDPESLVKKPKPVDWDYEQGRQDAQRYESYNQGWKDAAKSYYSNTWQVRNIAPGPTPTPWDENVLSKLPTPTPTP